MNNNDENTPVLLILGFLLGLIIGSAVTASSYREDAILKNFAEHNQLTGEWQWKEPTEKTK